MWVCERCNRAKNATQMLGQSAQSICLRQHSVWRGVSFHHRLSLHILSGPVNAEPYLDEVLAALIGSASRANEDLQIVQKDSAHTHTRLALQNNIYRRRTPSPLNFTRHGHQSSASGTEKSGLQECCISYSATARDLLLSVNGANGHWFIKMSTTNLSFHWGDWVEHVCTHAGGHTWNWYKFEKNFYKCFWLCHFSFYTLEPVTSFAIFHTFVNL